jgi:monoamine oxidase
MPSCDVVVVGAGLAGLCCADSLARAGCDVVVLEARDRVGGRAFSRRSGFADEQVAESGAEHVDAHHREILGLVARFGLPLVAGRAPDDPTRTLLDHGGRLASLASVDRATSGRLSDDLQRWRDATQTVAELVDLDDPTTGPFAEDLDRRPTSSFLADLELSPLARLVVGRELRSEFTLPPGEVSLLHAAWRAATSAAGGPGAAHVHRIGTGTQSVAEALAAELGDRIRLASPVGAVRHDTGPLRLRVAGTGEEWRAGSVVLAVPVPVLSRLELELAQPLPPALFELTYGQGGKVSIQYDRRLWLDQSCNGTVLSDRPYGSVWEASNDRPGDHGLLTALLGSHDGASFVALPRAADRVAAEVNRVFPGASGFAGHRVAHDWTNDPWSLGTVAAFGPGQVTALWPHLRDPVFGPVVLAGEHTDRFQGRMEGAARSGRRAAARVLAMP